MKNFYIVLFLLLISQSSFSQEDIVVEDPATRIENYYLNNYQEQIFIHADKRAYLTGEKIHFKVFCLEKTTSTFSKLSKVAYFEILSEDNAQLLSAKIELIDGSGFGEVYIPTNITSGNYILRGYTRWMRNFEPENYFHSMVTIINPFKRLGLNPLPKNEDVTIRFFPEGGSLINGLKSKVVFDCRYSNGHPTQVNGRLVQNDSISVVTFNPDKNGYGSFSFTPDIFAKYHVELLQKDSSTTTHKIPFIEGKGISLSVEEGKDNYKISLFCNDQSILEPSDRPTFTLHQKDKLVEQKSLTLLKGKSTLSIPKSKLQDGIGTICLFKENGELLKTRKIFVLKGSNINHVSLPKSSYTHREFVTLDLNDKKLSDGVVSVGSFHKNFASHNLGLSDYLLLDDAFKSFIYGIENYFSEDTQMTSSSINNLLIAYQSKKVNWLSVKKDKMLVPEYRGAIITGRVIDKETKKPETGIYAFVSIPGKEVQFNATRSMTGGFFTFEMKDFYGENDVIVQTDYTKDTIYSIEIDNPFSEKYLAIDLPELNIDESMQKWIETKSQSMQINNSYQKYVPKLPVLTERDSSTFFNEPDATYYLDDYTRFVVMEEVMREYVYGANVRKNKDGFHFEMVDLERNEIFRENPLMLFDGVPVFDADEIIALDPLKIEKIETVKRRFHKGYLDCHGLLNYTSYEGNLPGYNLHENALILEYSGLQLSRQYQFPDYTKSADKRSTVPDYRNTLYWNPKPRINIDSENKISFFTSDESGEFEIVFSGIDAEGIPFTDKLIFEVQSSQTN